MDRWTDPKPIPDRDPSIVDRDTKTYKIAMNAVERVLTSWGGAEGIDYDICVNANRHRVPAELTVTVFRLDEGNHCFLLKLERCSPPKED